LISRVYDEDVAPEIPADLIKKTSEAEGRAYSHRAIASSNLLKLEAGYFGNNHAWSKDTKTPTRLEEEPSVTFRLGKIAGGGVIPWCGGENSLRAWALSEVRIAQRHAGGVPALLGDVTAKVKAAKADWGKWEQDIPLLILEPDAENVWQGRVTAGDGERDILYCTRLGLRLASR
jgi:CRISPR-associated endonuclease/helicase Cas3